jgi:hypothetical protein
MIISNAQFKVFELHEIEKFIKNTIKELTINYSEFTEGIEQEGLKVIINDVIAVCKQNNIKDEELVFLMIVCNIKYKFKIPLHAGLENIIATTIDERLKVENFVNAVASKSYRLIELIRNK